MTAYFSGSREHSRRLAEIGRFWPGGGGLKVKQDKSHKVWLGRGGQFFRAFHKVILLPQGDDPCVPFVFNVIAQGQGHHDAG
ncbi:MAG: hypothetical protein ABF665_05055 [Gluconacetobacter sp.]